MPTSLRIIENWFQEVQTLVLSHDVNKNMLIFSILEAKAAQIHEREVASFLDDAFREYCKKAARLQMRGWFYAWFDEMSGTLRCSFSEAHGVTDLPFRCKINTVDTAAKIAAFAFSSPYTTGIPKEELADVGPFEEDAGEREYELAVFARPVMTTA